MWRVELDVLGPEPDQFLDLLAQDPGHVLQKEVERRVGFGGQLGRPEVRVHARTRQRDLHGPLGAAPRVHELLDREMTPAPQLPDYPEGLRTFGRLVSHRLVSVPLAPQPGVNVGSPKALYGLYQLALERLPAHLTVRNDGEACPFLQPDSPFHGPILDTLELGGGEPACGVAYARLEQLLGSQEAADDVRAGGDDVLHTGQSSTRVRPGKPKPLSRLRLPPGPPAQRRNQGRGGTPRSRRHRGTVPPPPRAPAVCSRPSRTASWRGPCRDPLRYKL